jgi:hypothetical protein
VEEKALLNTNPGMDWTEFFKGIFDWCDVRKWPVKDKMTAFFIAFCFIISITALWFGFREDGIWMLRFTFFLSVLGFGWIFISRHILKNTK